MVLIRQPAWNGQPSGSENILSKNPVRFYKIKPGFILSEIYNFRLLPIMATAGKCLVNRIIRFVVVGVVTNSRQGLTDCIQIGLVGRKMKMKFLIFQAV